ncbi:MAG: pyridinium-3,5-bisthiocarboxylic acid mononucleotide nickel chelatase [Acidimicrobiaceae bacterium]|nr:pyridinium-3,5-bisthiocarboxylic acid mononucleotide nickel chelatase [Acidimicrobiaceae bacterium]
MAQPPRTQAWFHCFAGIAGDMALGSLVDAGADLDEVCRILERLPFGGWSVEAEPVLRGGIAATHIDVRARDDAVVRTHAHIVGLIEEARLPDRVRQRSLATFNALAEVEGRLHHRHPSQVHFHEVGGIDAIVDIVGTCAALELLEVDVVHASPVATGTGMVRAAHGLLPNPAPAVVALLAGAPTYGREVSVELTTPTGAALLATLVSTWGPLPAMTITATGFGAGSRELDGMPNATQVILGTAASASLPERPSQPVVLLEANVDDATGETIAYAIAALIDAGAHDAWVTPIVMKKGRPAYTVSALVDPAVVEQVARTLVAETGTLGVRGQTMERWPEPRTTSQVEVDGMPVRVKVSPGRVKVEHDDAARAARHTGAPLRSVLSLAEERARASFEPGSGRGQAPQPAPQPGPGPDEDEAG